MRALSLTRPWTTLVLECGKNIENRTWQTPYRGPLVIHGAKSWDGEAAADLAYTIIDGSAVAFAELRHLKGLYPTGFLGVVDLIDVCDKARDGDPTYPFRARCGCGPWAMVGQYHWRLTNPRRFAEPIPGNGRLGLYDPPADAIEAVARLLVDA